MAKQALGRGKLSLFEFVVRRAPGEETAVGGDLGLGCYLGIAQADYDGRRSPRTSTEVWALHCSDDPMYNSMHAVTLPASLALNDRGNVFGDGDVVGVEVDRGTTDTVSFSRNGEPLGAVFEWRKCNTKMTFANNDTSYLGGAS